MDRQLANILDFDLAWRRTQSDQSHHAFVRHPFECELVDSDRANWIAAIRAQIHAGEFRTGAHLLVDALKPNGAIRPGSYLRPRDRLVFTALLGSAFPYIQSALAWAQDRVDFSYRLAANPDTPRWIRDSMGGWRRFDTETLRHLESGFTCCSLTSLATTKTSR